VIDNNAHLKATIMMVMDNIAVNAIIVMTYGQFAWYEPLLMSNVMKMDEVDVEEMVVG